MLLHISGDNTCLYRIWLLGKVFCHSGRGGGNRYNVLEFGGFGIINEGTNHIALVSFLDFLIHLFKGPVHVEILLCNDRLSSRRHGANGENIEIGSINRVGNTSGDGRGGHRDVMPARLVELLQFCLLGNAEFMLFIYDGESQAAGSNVVAEDGVGTNQDVQIAGFKGFQEGFSLLFLRLGRQETHGNFQFVADGGEGLVMLTGKNQGRSHNNTLASILRHKDTGQDGNHSLAAANVSGDDGMDTPPGLCLPDNRVYYRRLIVCQGERQRSNCLTGRLFAGRSLHLRTNQVHILTAQILIEIIDFLKVHPLGGMLVTLGVRGLVHLPDCRIFGHEPERGSEQIFGSALVVEPQEVDRGVNLPRHVVCGHPLDFGIDGHDGTYLVLVLPKCQWGGDVKIAPEYRSLSAENIAVARNQLVDIIGGAKPGDVERGLVPRSCLLQLLDFCRVRAAAPLPLLFHYPFQGAEFPHLDIIDPGHFAEVNIPSWKKVCDIFHRSKALALKLRLLLFGQMQLVDRMSHIIFRLLPWRCRLPPFQEFLLCIVFIYYSFIIKNIEILKRFS